MTVSDPTQTEAWTALTNHRDALAGLAFVVQLVAAHAPLAGIVHDAPAVGQQPTFRVFRIRSPILIPIFMNFEIGEKLRVRSITNQVWYWTIVFAQCIILESLKGHSKP